MPLSSAREANGALASASFLHGRHGILAPPNADWVSLGTGDDEIVIHNLKALHTLAVSNELFLRRPVMNEQHVGIALLGHLDSLACPQRDHAHFNSCLGLEQGQEIAEQTGIFGGSGRGHSDETLIGDYRASRHTKANDEQRDKARNSR